MFYKAALVAQDRDNFESVDYLNEEDKDILRYEKVRARPRVRDRSHGADAPSDFCRSTNGTRPRPSTGRWVRGRAGRGPGLGKLTLSPRRRSLCARWAQWSREWCVLSTARPLRSRSLTCHPLSAGRVRQYVERFGRSALPFFVLIASLAVNGANLFYPNQVRCAFPCSRLSLLLTLGNLLSAVWHRRRHEARHPPRRRGQLGSGEPLFRIYLSLFVCADSARLPSHSTSARRA